MPLRAISGAGWLHVMCIENVKSLAVLLLSVLLFGCAEPEWLDVKIPGQALDVYQGHPFSKRSRQTSYKHEVAYSDETAIQSVTGNLAGEWKRCKYGGGIWQDFIDSTGNEPLRVHQRIETWRTDDKNNLLFMVLRYESVYDKDDKYDPKTGLQSVAIIEHIAPWWALWEGFDELCEGYT